MTPFAMNVFFMLAIGTEKVQHGLKTLISLPHRQNKLKDNDTISFPDSLVDEVADSTEKFSFAYLKEALWVSYLLPENVRAVLTILSSVSTLFRLATQEKGEQLEFEPLLKQTIKSLRKALDDGVPKGTQPGAPVQKRQQQLHPLMLSKEEMEKHIKEFKEQREAWELNNKATASLRLGRRFIY
jgi:hypothetical protein